MLGASLYVIVCSARNRLRMRLRRLREPRYLAGAVVGAAYLYFSFFGRLRGARSDRARADLAEAGSNLEQIFLSVTGNNRAGQP